MKTEVLTRKFKKDFLNYHENMRVEIDQSGKIENTNRPTVLAFSNKECGVLVILAKDKKRIQKYFREIDKPKLFIPITFISLVWFLIKNHAEKYSQIIIDREYPGYEKLISRQVKLWVQKTTSRHDLTVSIAQIGKKSKAHDLAWKELQSKSHKNSTKVSADTILKIIKANKESGSI